MPSTRFATDHERYIGSGIVALSQLPRASEDDLIIHAKELKERKRRFRPGTCKPWQKENHLKAELSHRHWKNRHIGKSQRLDGHDFPELQFREDADIRIIENMALLQVVRSSKASRWEQRICNGKRQWVVDFFRKGKTVLSCVWCASMKKSGSRNMVRLHRSITTNPSSHRRLRQ